MASDCLKEARAKMSILLASPSGGTWLVKEPPLPRVITAMSIMVMTTISTAMTATNTNTIIITTTSIAQREHTQR